MSEYLTFFPGQIKSPKHLQGKTNKKKKIKIKITDQLGVQKAYWLESFTRNIHSDLSCGPPPKIPPHPVV